jgi:SAM-dependent MidA family methyltransferase
MSDWLYGEDGYYGGVGQVGREGDFLTSPSVSMFFGGALANKFVSLVQGGKLAKNSVVCEFGANSLFAIKDFASFLAGVAPELLKTVKFVIVEKQTKTAEFQQKELREFFSDVDFEIVESLSGYEDRDAFVFANEIFDAFACELFLDGKSAVVENHKIEFTGCEQETVEAAKLLGVTKGEVAVGYEEFAKELYDSFKNSYFVTFDYGQDFPRNDFSIRAYKEHKTEPLFAIENLGDFFKNSDITYDVNFAHLKEAFMGAGFDFAEYKNQASAMIDFGISDLLQIYLQKAGEAAYLREAQKAKALISPEGFGERFKMISFTKGLK